MAETPYPYLPPDIAAIIARLVKEQSGGTVSAVTIRARSGSTTIAEERISFGADGADGDDDEAPTEVPTEQPSP